MEKYKNFKLKGFLKMQIGSWIKGLKMILEMRCNSPKLTEKICQTPWHLAFAPPYQSGCQTQLHCPTTLLSNYGCHVNVNQHIIKIVTRRIISRKKKTLNRGRANISSKKKVHESWNTAYTLWIMTRIVIEL